MRHYAEILVFVMVAAFVPLAAQADVTISSAATLNMGCANGVCAPTAANAVLNAGDLETMLASQNVTVTTTGSGIQADNIDIAAALSWTSNSRLALDAYRSINIGRALEIKGVGGLSLSDNDGGNQGRITFSGRGNVTFNNLSSQLVIHGVAFMLVGDISTLAGDIAQNPAGNFALANNYNAGLDGPYANPPIGTTFTGSFEGLGHTISKLRIRTRSFTNMGLFAEVGTGGAIKNLGLHGELISAPGGDVGGLAGQNSGTLYGVDVEAKITIVGEQGGVVIGGIAGYNYGTIEQSSAEGAIKAPESSDTAGGAAGYNYGTLETVRAGGAVTGDYGVGAGLVGDNEATIAESFATGSINANTAGGLVGRANQGSISNSYATGGVFGATNQTAGFAASSNGTITASYSTGIAPVGFITDYDNRAESYCYWDTTTSGTSIGSGPGITGRTTQQLQRHLPRGFDPKIWTQNPNINGGLPYLIANPPFIPN